MKQLVVLSGLFLVGCSSAPHARIASPSDATQPLVVGSVADIEKAGVLAVKCQLEGTTAGMLNGQSALYIRRSTLQMVSPVSPVWECFSQGLLSPGFSDQFGLVGSEADQR